MSVTCRLKLEFLKLNEIPFASLLQNFIANREEILVHFEIFSLYFYVRTGEAVNGFLVLTQTYRNMLASLIKKQLGQDSGHRRRLKIKEIKAEVAKFCKGF